VGAGVEKPEPGGGLAADARTGEDGRLARWQDSQTVDDGMCEAAPGGLVGGMPTSSEMPAKVLLLPDGRWQAAQLVEMPVWFIVEPLNFAPSPTGKVAIEEPEPT
jgi:hypothetical protein